MSSGLLLSAEEEQPEIISPFQNRLGNHGKGQW